MSDLIQVTPLPDGEQSSLQTHATLSSTLKRVLLLRINLLRNAYLEVRMVETKKKRKKEIKRRTRRHVCSPVAGC